MNSTVSPSCHFGMRHRGVAAARPTWPAYVDGTKRETISQKDCIIVASTWRCSVQFGLLHNLSYVGKLCLRDDRNAEFL